MDESKLLPLAHRVEQLNPQLPCLRFHVKDWVSKVAMMMLLLATRAEQVEITARHRRMDVMEQWKGI